MMHRAKKISTGRWLYRGMVCYNLGYYEPERRVVWEAVDADGHAVAHGFSLKQLKWQIDCDEPGGYSRREGGNGNDKTRIRKNTRE